MMKKFMTALALVSTVYGAAVEDGIVVDRSSKPVGKFSTVATFTPKSETILELILMINPSTINVANQYQDKQEDPNDIGTIMDSEISLCILFRTSKKAKAYEQAIKRINVNRPSFCEPLSYAVNNNTVSIHSGLTDHLFKTIFSPLLEQNPDIDSEKMDKFLKAMPKEIRI